MLRTRSLPLAVLIHTVISVCRTLIFRGSRIKDRVIARKAIFDPPSSIPIFQFTWKSPCVSHSCCDSVDRQERRVKQLLPISIARFGLLVSLPAARQQLDLQEAERVDVWIAHSDRPLEHWRLIEQLSFACDL